MKHGPAPRRVINTLAVLQTPGVVEVKVTGSPELALAAIANGDTPKI
jgi:hypothetical protein